MTRRVVFTEQQAADGSWYWTATRNGEVVAMATEYSSKSNARRAHRNFRKALAAGHDTEAKP